MQQIELTPELKASADRMLESCNDLERRAILLDMLNEAVSRKQYALALHRICLAYERGIMPLSSALPLAELHLKSAMLTVEKMRIDQQREANRKKQEDDVRALMSICTAEFGK